MNPGTSNASSAPTTRIPTAAWVVVAALAAGLAAVFVFNVPISTVFTFGLIGLMLFSHLFMHGSHDGHGGHDQHGAQGAQVSQTSESHGNVQGEHSGHIDGPQSQAVTDPNADQKNAHSGHQGGCC